MPRTHYSHLPLTTHHSFPVNLKLIACEILFRECSFLAAKSVNRIDIEFLPKGLHDIGRKRMFEHLNAVVQSQDETQYDAIILGYALCSGGIVGLEAGSIPIIVPRAHDCITLFLGDRFRYKEFFEANPGTYFKTSGWVERGDGLNPFPSGSVTSKSGESITYDQMIEKYGVDNAKYIWDQLTGLDHYTKMAFIETGVEPDNRFEKETQRLADEKNLQYEKLNGDLSLMKRLMDGPWDETDFLVVPPGKTIINDYTDDIIGTV